MTPSRKEQGDEAEAFVASWLSKQGAEILETNLRLGHLELDIVAKQNRVVLVVEVRYRGTDSWTTPLSSVSQKKRLFVRRGGERLWNRRFKNDPSVDRMRFDLAGVTAQKGEWQLEYIPAAF